MSPAEDPTEVTDARLLERHVAGDKNAFGELVRRHRDRLWAVALRTLGDREEAAEAVQDALVSAFRRASGFRGESAVTTWLHRIVVNACLDRLRRASIRPSMAVGDDQQMDAIADRRQRTRTDEISAAETAIDVSAALQALPAEQRLPLVLIDMMGFTVEDAARVLDVPAGTVKSRCARGRARLAPRLAHLRNRASARHVPSEGGGDRS